MIPKLRFPEFNDEWKATTVDSAFAVNTKKFNLPSEFYYIDLESVKKGRLGEVGLMNLEDAPSRAQRKLEGQCILFQMVRPYQKNNLLFTNELLNGDVVASTGYSVLKPIDGSIKYYFTLLQNDSFINRVLIRSTGSNYPAINSSELKRIRFYDSQSITEKAKLGELFSLLSNKINLLTKKKEALETYKKGLMQKIFSQELNFKLEDGTDYPEWETLRIEDISEERSVRGFEEYPLLSITLNNGIVPQELGGKSDSSSSDKSNYKLVRVGDIGYNSMRMWQGASGVSSYEGIVSPAYTVFSLKERANAQYIGYLFKTHRLIGTFKSHSQGLTSDTWNLKYPTLKRIKIKLPSLDEQLRVVKILSQIELNLERLTKRINATEQLKKGLLKHMFV